MIFSLEGNIGSGKSTILQQLKDRLVCNPCIKFLQEPVAEWENIKDTHNFNSTNKYSGDSNNSRTNTQSHLRKGDLVKHPNY